jgi:hypothetical protein
MKYTLLTLAAGAALMLSAPAALAGEHYGKGPKGGDYAQKMFQAMDVDGDGQVTQAEFDAHHAGKFQALDADGSGAVSADEFAAQAAERRAEMKEKRGAWKNKPCAGKSAADGESAAE